MRLIAHLLVKYTRKKCNAERSDYFFFRLYFISIDATPASTIPNWRAAFFDTSIMRPGANGPRSLMVTFTERPLARLVTFTCVPNGNVRCAAVSFSCLNGSPLAVVRP